MWAGMGRHWSGRRVWAWALILNSWLAGGMILWLADREERRRHLFLPTDRKRRKLCTPFLCERERGFWLSITVGGILTLGCVSQWRGRRENTCSWLQTVLRRKEAHGIVSLFSVLKKAGEREGEALCFLPFGGWAGVRWLARKHSVGGWKTIPVSQCPNT